VVQVRATADWDPGQLDACVRVEFPCVYVCSPFCNGVGLVQGSAHAVATLGADDIDFSGMSSSTNITLGGRWDPGRRCYRAPPCRSA